MEGGGTRTTKSTRTSDVPMRVRRRQSDARWRANVASCFETLKNIIPVNKRASKRQISKAYVLQETSKHIHFLEGILITLLQEKAKEEGKVAESYVDSFDQIKTDFIKNQRQKIAALCNERKYKRNKYKLYIADNLIHTEHSQPLPDASQGKKKTVHKIHASPADVKSPRKAEPKPSARKPRAQAQPKSQTVRVVVHPMKHILNRVRKPKEHKDFISTDSSLAHVLHPSADQNQIFESDSDSCSVPVKCKQRRPRKRRAPNQENRQTKRGRPNSMMMVHKAPTMKVVENPGLNSKKYTDEPEGCSANVVATSAPYFYYHIWPSALKEPRADVPPEFFVARPEISFSPGLDAPTKLTADVPHTPGSLDQKLTGLKRGGSTPVLTSIHLNSTPAKKVPIHPEFSTPGVSGGPGAPFHLNLTPITKTSEHSDHDQLTTPHKQIYSQTDVSPGLGFTPVVLPNDWMCTPTKSPVATCSSFTSEHMDDGHEPLECDEDISSDEDDLKKSFRSVMSSGHSQAFQHRESKLHPVRTRHRTASLQGDTSSTKSGHSRNDSISCKRSLNMSLGLEREKQSFITTNDTWTEECLQDFDRYYEQLKEAKSSIDGELDDTKSVDLVPIEAMWQLVEDVTTSSHSDQPGDSLEDEKHTELREHGNKQACGEHFAPDLEQIIYDYVGGSSGGNEFVPLEAIGTIFSHQPQELEEANGKFVPMKREEEQLDPDWFTYQVSDIKDEMFISMKTSNNCIERPQSNKKGMCSEMYIKRELQQPEDYVQETFNTGLPEHDRSYSYVENVSHEEVIDSTPMDLSNANTDGWRLEVDLSASPLS